MTRGAFFSCRASSKATGVASSPRSTFGVWLRTMSGGSMFHWVRIIERSASLKRECRYWSINANVSIRNYEDGVLRLVLRHRRRHDDWRAFGPRPGLGLPENRTPKAAGVR